VASEHRRQLERLGLPPIRHPSSEGQSRLHASRLDSASATTTEIEPAGACLALIATRNYLAQASIAAQSFARYHPYFPIFLLLVDGEAEDRNRFPYGAVVLLDDLEVPDVGWYSTKYNAAELANALKPAFLLHLAAFKANVIYLDCDIAVFARFTAMLSALEQHDMVLVPHMLAPYQRPEQFWIHPNNADIFNAGLINAGCFAMRLTSCRQFLRFWLSSNMSAGTFHNPAGGQTDQQYLNWALILGSNVTVLRDTSYNVAYWNLHDRQFRRIVEDDVPPRLEVDGSPLTFFHFSGYDPNDELTLSRYDNRYSVYTLPAVAYILNWYSEQVHAAPLEFTSSWPYRFDRIANGFVLTPFIRTILKKYEAYIPRFDGRVQNDADALCAFLMTPLPATGSLLPLIAAEIYDCRPDLVDAWPNAHIDEFPNGFWRWFCRYGGDEFHIPLLVTRFRRTLTSDSLVGFAQEIADLAQAHGRSEAFLGDDRRSAADWLRTIGHGGMADSLLETQPEWAFFNGLGALIWVYESRADLQASFPEIFGASHDAFADWVDEHCIREHDLPPEVAACFRLKTDGAVLARMFSLLSRREDLGRLAREELLSDHPIRLLRELIRCSGEGLEYDVEDLVVFCFLHRRERHLLVPLYLELPVIRRLPTSSRLPENKLALLPPEVRVTDWAARGIAHHDACFDKLEIAFEDEVRRQDELAGAPGYHVFDVLRSISSSRAPEAVAIPYRKALRRAASGTMDASIPRATENIPVNVFGFFLADIGVGESTRGLARAIGLLRPVRHLPLCTGHLKSGASVEQLFHHYDFLSDVNVFVSYPHSHEDFFGTFPRAYFRHRRNIIHLAWEQLDWNLHWKSIYERYDEIWAISKFAAEPFRRIFGGHVRVVPNVLNTEEYPACREACSVRFTRDSFVFLYVFDANSSIERKNPEGVIEAFIDAFQGTQEAASVKLVLKVSNLSRNEHASRVDAMMSRAARSGMHIVFDGRSLSRTALMHLIADADCYVSLHRAEGFGYTMAEAMYYGIPVIASGYSGNLEYMDPENSFLVPCEEQLVEVPDGPFQRGSVWGHPSHDAAVEMMRLVFRNRGLAKQVGEKGRESVLNQLTAEAVAEGLRECLLGRKHGLPD
jgi:glycosyltransferase involved in cell wall biosynthesis